jgi:hypothetical protein
LNARFVVPALMASSRGDVRIAAAKWLPVRDDLPKSSGNIPRQRSGYTNPMDAEKLRDINFELQH